MIPVNFSCKIENRPWQRLDVGLVPAFNFVDTCIAGFTDLEIQGVQSTMAAFAFPDTVWKGTDQRRANAEKPEILLRMNAEVLPGLGTGQTSRLYPFVETACDKRKNEAEHAQAATNQLTKR